MKIGIAVTTYNRPNHLAYWIEQMRLFKPKNIDIVIDGFVIADDSKNNPRLGIAKQKNDCLRMLKKHDPDFYFLFDDDVFVKRQGWEQLFIQASIQTNQHHFQLMKESNDTEIVGIAEDKDLPNSIPVNVFNNTNGCFMFMTKQAIEKVGAYNEEFGKYGMEHADWTNRAHRAGCTPFGAYSCPDKADEVLFSLDLEPETELHRKLKHKGSMSSAEALMHVGKAHKVYAKEQPIYIPL